MRENICTAKRKRRMLICWPRGWQYALYKWKTSHLHTQNSTTVTIKWRTVFGFEGCTVDKVGWHCNNMQVVVTPATNCSEYNWHLHSDIFKNNLKLACCDNPRLLMAALWLWTNIFQPGEPPNAQLLRNTVITSTNHHGKCMTYV